MALFRYKATQDGLRSQGEIDAVNEQMALGQLARQGLQVYQLRAVEAFSRPKAGLAEAGFRRAGAVRAEEILMCLQELSTLLNAGIPLADAVLNTTRGYEQRPLGEALKKTYSSLRSGASFAQALRDSELRLPEYVHQLVAAGEETGQLATSLASAVRQMDADARFRREIRNALTYPMVLVVSGLLATLVVFVFVVPKFAHILSNPKADIPMLSRWVLGSGVWLVNNKLLAGAVVAGLAVTIWHLFSSTSVRQEMWEFAGRVPLLDRWVEHVELTRWGSMFAVLLQHRLPILEALRHSRNSLTGLRRRQQIDMVYRDVKTGHTLAAAMQTQRFMDSMGLNLIRVGEQSGRLAQTTASLADMHRIHAEQSMKQFLVLLEPVTILMVSVVLGGIMISVMLAITSLTNVL